MQKVNIYIDITYKGRMEYGQSTYSIILEYIKNKIPYTKQYIGGYAGTTRNRTGILACIEALNYLVRPCIINLTINSKFIHNSIHQEWYKNWIRDGKNKKGEPANNLDLWEPLSVLISQHDLTTKYETINQYSSYVQTMSKKIEIEYKEDKGNEIV